MPVDQHVPNVCKACFFHLRNKAKIRDYLSTDDTEIRLMHLLLTNWIVVTHYHMGCQNS